MKPLTRVLVMVNLIILLVYTTYYVQNKETILSDGALLLFELAPVDPRSLIQGDFMVLDYAVSRGFNQDSLPKKGYFVVTKDAQGVAQKERVQVSTTPLNPGEFLVNYTKPDWQINIGAESYFFEEGTASIYEAAKYGGIKIDNAGNSLLIGLYDEDRKLLGGENERITEGEN
ncbi:GDYXXLXY domain-containing protein [Neolewinella persica]|uniref:GDYXXLXY domain-containing protein n=1 Tax=Neolewinella persica TaxID=70998 RepID=UPI00035E3584|nr:GDYXXLXY domain-containing protein [Neolewinella persica]